jgi:DNA polymerase bacteriophage-type
MSFLDADYAAIEARIVNWLAGQEDALARFRAYDAAETEEEKHRMDPYRIMASSIFGISVDAVNKFPQRFVGKSAELGCGFGLGPPKFRVNCLKVGRYDLPLGLESKAVKTWRTTHKKVVSFWYELESAAKHAILRKGETFAAGQHIKFQCRDIEGMPFLLMRLPSGRKIAYPKPRISNDRITLFGNVKGATWGDISIWGGDLTNHCTQGTAADVMTNGVHRSEKAGYETATLIHDQCLSYVKPGQTAEEFVRLLTDLPDWAKGLPIEAEGGLVPFYKKD